MSKVERAALDPARIAKIGRSLGEAAPRATIDALVAFGELFLTWNAKINLGGMRTADELSDPHLRDAFAAARFISSTDRVVDVGSGGGLPIIPMALLRPGATFDLFEATAKKVAFLRTAVRELEMGDRIRIHQSRMKAPVPDGLLAKFDVACSRATFAPSTWLPLGLELVREGGQILVFATGDPDTGCPPPTEDFRYGPNRRLLVFRGHVPRET